MVVQCSFHTTIREILGLPVILVEKSVHDDLSLNLHISIEYFGMVFTYTEFSRNAAPVMWREKLSSVLYRT